MPSEFEIYGDIVVFGIVVRFKTENHGLLRLALTLFPSCDQPASQCGVVEVYLVLESRPLAAPIATEIRGSDLHIVQEHVRLDADGLKGRGICALAPDLTDEAMIGEAIHTVALFLVCHAGRVPIHASAIILDETAIILAGRSGAGKSSLALAADCAGLPVLSDDTVYVQTAPLLRVWSFGGPVHVFEKDAPAGATGTMGAMRLRLGRWKRALPINRPRYRADRAILCVLQPGDRVSLGSMREEEAVALLTSDFEPGYEFYGARTYAALRDLAAGGCWRLALGRDPAAAIGALMAARPGGNRRKVPAS